MPTASTPNATAARAAAGSGAVSRPARRTTNPFWDPLESMLTWAGMFVGAIFVIGLVTWLIQRRRLSLTERLLAASAPAGDPALQAPPKTWQEAVAEKLARSGHAPNDGRQQRRDVEPGRPAGMVEVPKPKFTELTLELLRQLEWKRLELFMTRYFTATGVRAEMTCMGADGGVDIHLYQPGAERAYACVQCKAWASDLVGVALVRELRGVMAAQKIDQGVFVTTSDFTTEARAFADANAITALNASNLVERFAVLPESARVDILREVTAGDFTTPSCPACETKMVWKETAKFWACPKYPRCRSKPIYARRVKI